MYTFLEKKIATLKTVRSSGREGAKYGHFSNVKSRHERIRAVSIMKVAVDLFIYMINVERIGPLSCSRSCL